jgi:hypothetical protein
MFPSSSTPPLPSRSGAAATHSRFKVQGSAFKVWIWPFPFNPQLPNPPKRRRCGIFIEPHAKNNPPSSIGAAPFPQERHLAGAGLADDVDVLPLVGDQYAKRLGIAPAFAFADCDGWFVVHGPKTSRHSFPQEVSMSSDIRSGIDLSAGRNALGHAGEVMAAGFEIRTVGIQYWQDTPEGRYAKEAKLAG